MLKSSLISQPTYGTMDDSSQNLLQQNNHGGAITADTTCPGTNKEDKESQPTDSDGSSCSQASRSDKVVKSINSNEMTKRKNIIMKYPDGTYSYACKRGEMDPWQEVRYNRGNNGLRAFQITQIDDEVQFLAENLDYILDPDTSMRNYQMHRKTLCLFLVLNLVFEVLLYVYLFQNMDFIMATLSEIYRGVSVERLLTIFQVSNGIDIAINVFMYTFGFFALWTHKVTYYNMFLMVLIVAIFSRIVISYLNILNLLMFILKIVMYLYARFVLSLLYTVLLVPSFLEQA